MFCKNYLEQYNRAKSIKQLTKDLKGSYKLISHQNSALLKKENNQNNSQATKPTVSKTVKRKLVTNISRESRDKSMKSVSSFVVNDQKIKQSKHQGLVKEHKIEKSVKNINKDSQQFSTNTRKKFSTNISKWEKSTVQKNFSTKKLSIDNAASKYSTVVEYKPHVYFSSVIRYPEAKPEPTKQQMYPEKEPRNHRDSSLNDIYERMKKVLEINQIKEKQWEQERTFYKEKIKSLEAQLREKSIRNSRNDITALKIKRKIITK